MIRTFFIASISAAIATGPAIADNQLRIGFLSTLSGGTGIFGKHQKHGFDLAVEQLGGKVGGLETKIIYGDDQRKPDVGLQVVTKMIKKDKVHFIAGVVWSNVLMAIQKSVTRAEVFLVSTNAGASPMAGKLCNPYFFSTSWQNDQAPEAMGKLLQEEGVKDVFMIAPNYQAGKDVLIGFQRLYKGNIKGRTLTKLGATDYQPEISKIRAAKPGAVFAFLPGPMGIAFMKQWAAAGVKGSIPLYTSYVVDYLTLPALGEAAMGTYHTNFWRPDSDVPENKKFVAAYKKKYGYMPSHFSAQAYDAPFLFDSAIRAAGGDLSNKNRIRRELLKANFKSIRGNFRYNTNHFPIQSFYKRQVVRGSDGKPKIVSHGAVLTDHKDAYYSQCNMK